MTTHGTWLAQAGATSQCRPWGALFAAWGRVYRGPEGWRAGGLEVRCGAWGETSSSRSGDAAPSTSRLPEMTIFLPPMATSVIVFDSPGSKRTEAPGGDTARYSPLQLATARYSLLQLATYAVNQILTGIETRQTLISCQQNSTNQYHLQQINF